MPLEIFAPRANLTQQVNTVRRRVRFSDAALAVAQQFGTLPVGSFINFVHVQIVTGFNAATTNVLTFGTTQASANELVAAADVDETAIGFADVTRGKGMGLTQVASIASTQAGQSVDTTQGGVGLWAKYTQTGAAATAGEAVIVIGFTPPNDT